MDEFYDVTPLCVLFVIKGTKGDRLLFKYPYDDDESGGHRRNHKAKYGKSPYAVRIEEDLYGSQNQHSTNSVLRNGDLIGLSDDIISFLFAVRQEICAQPLEVKVNDVRFVCHPMVLQSSIKQPSHSATSSQKRRGGSEDKTDLSNVLLFNIVFGLQGNARRSVVCCYQDLCKRLAIALKHEEGRCEYLSKQAKIMIDCLEEMQSSTEASGFSQSLYRTHLQKSELAQELKQVFTDVKERGFVQLFINGWIKVSFCLPQKIHCFPGIGSLEPEKIRRFIDLMRPYHGMLLLKNVQDLLDEIPADASPDLARLIKVTSPLKSFQTMSADTDLPVTLVFRLIGHLIYWGKATLIYPLCETNVYCISPSASFSSSQLLADFAESFPFSTSMLSVLSEFSTPISLGEFTSPLNWDAQQQAERVQMVVWFLKRFMLLQLRTYVYFCPSSPDTKFCVTDPTPKSHAQVEEEKQFRFTLEKILKNKAEIDAVLRLSAAENRDDLRTFIRLLRYLNGEHHLEDLMYRENLRRPDLLRILMKFNDIIVLSTHEDELSSIFIEKF